MKLNSKDIKKIFEYLDVKIKQKLREKSYGRGQYPVKYLLYEADSPYLAVVFGSCPRVGVKSRYNYVRSLSEFKINKLFILDEYGEDGRGCYYLGHDRDFSVRDNTEALIDYISNKVGAEHLIYCGSSKGGWASLYFGIDKNNAAVIAGAPQYLLGNYFLAVPEVRLEEYVFGSNWTQEDIDYLNNLVRNKITGTSERCDLYLHYSDREHTYFDNVQYLIEDLNRMSLTFHEDLCHYENHGDVSIYYPTYLKKCIAEIIEKYSN